ncbi:hypothetical protein JDF658_10000 [Carboxydocella sp. JDF658]|nr:hypothetical protein JDF658_10000 [Carboxydocella sp. JDF658]
MKRMRIKKSMATFVAATMLFGSTGMAFASVDDSINRLNGVGLVKGYADGSFKPEQNITRAEYAAIAVRALGLEAAAQYAKGPTKFKDVPANHWASGYINVAVDQGIITGYPDGKFRPDANVTAAEAIAMMVRVLGYEPVLTGTWPTKYISKASALGLLDNVSIDNFNAPAKRGDVFVIADDALDVKPLEQKGYGDTKTYEESTKTLLELKLKVTEKKDMAVGASVVHDGVAADQISVNGSVYDLVGTVNPFDFYGLKTKVWFNKDNDVIAVKADEEEIFTDKIKSFSGNKVVFYGKGEKELASSVTLYNNFAAGTPAVLGSNVNNGDVVKVVLDDKGKIIKFIKFAYPNTDYVKEIDVANKKITFKRSGSSISLKDKDEDYIQIFKNGKKATLADIKVGDVVSYYYNGDKYLIAATDAVVSGKLTSVADAAGNNVKLVVGDKTVYTNGTAEYTTNNGDSFSTATTANLNDDLVGQNVTVKLGLNGEAAYVISDKEATSKTFDVLVRNITKETTYSGNTNSTKTYIKVTKFDGTMLVYEVDNDDYSTVGDMANGYVGLSTVITNPDTAEINPKDLVKITLNDSGKVSKVVAIDSNTIKTPTDIDKDTNVLYVSGTPYIITSDTKVIKSKKLGGGSSTAYLDETEYVTWDNAEDYVAQNLTNTKIVIDGSKVKYVFLDSTTAVASDYKWGVVVGSKFGIGGGDYAVKINIDGTEKQYTLDVASFTYSNQPIIFKLNADGTKLNFANGLVEMGGLETVEKVETVGDKVIITMTNGNQRIGIASKVKYFDKSGGKNITPITGVSSGDNVRVYEFLDKDGKYQSPTDGMIDFVVKE